MVTFRRGQAAPGLVHVLNGLAVYRSNPTNVRYGSPRRTQNDRAVRLGRIQIVEVHDSGTVVRLVT